MEIAVFGAGLVGSLYALMMSKLGYSVTVYEKRSDPRAGITGSARSINLALSTRGRTALEAAGILHLVEPLTIPMKGRMVHKIGKETELQPYSITGDCIYSVSRNQLNQLLINQADAHPNCSFKFDHNLLHAQTEDQMPTLSTKNGVVFRPKADFYMATDGANSLARSYIKGAKYSVDKISHGYKEIEIPAFNGKHQLVKNALHIWPRGEFMMIGLPNLDGSYTGTLFLPEMGANSFDELRTELDVKQFFEEKFPDVVALIPDFSAQFFENPTSNLATVWTNDWYDEEKKIGLIGDASHGIVPFYGQGMNAGFEDCRLLFEAVQQTSNLDQVFTQFARERKKDADAIAYLSMGNFIEMRDLVAQPKFILQKKIEAQFQVLPNVDWMPLYDMVSFSKIPYSEVYERSLIQQQVMDEVLALPQIEAVWDRLPLSLEIKLILDKYGFLKTS
jgi:kynurenine 3-monooxygenase